MTKRLERDAIYLKRHFDAEIIVLCVRWCITYKLSYRDLSAMMAERALVVSHTTTMRWVPTTTGIIIREYGRLPTQSIVSPTSLRDASTCLRRSARSRPQYPQDPTSI
jgi:hypothetical protein